jgi:Ca-activated chloride channel family protein
MGRTIGHLLAIVMLLAAGLLIGVCTGFGCANRSYEDSTALHQQSRHLRSHMAPARAEGAEVQLEAPPADPLADLRDPSERPNREAYDHIEDNPFLAVAGNPLSTFSIDVDTASYSNVRRMLNDGYFPPAGAARIEEMVNYFPYDYEQPSGDAPFHADVEVASCPWDESHKLARIGIQGRRIEAEARPDANLVFLIDVSGSMSDPRKLPLVKESLRMLVRQMRPTDRIALAVYAGNSGLVLDSTPVSAPAEIEAAILRLEPGGSTNGAAGIQLAYEIARRNFIRDGGINRVILCTDGDFNVGLTSRSDLVKLIEKEARSGVFLSILGYGAGNWQDATMEELSNRGNGNFAYIDTLNEARKVLVEQMNGTIQTIAKDVKIQVEFNPAKIAAYRLIGYENRMLRAEDFNDDNKDAGEIGAGHQVTAIYELVPAEVASNLPQVDPLKYQQRPQLSEAAANEELMTVKIRHKPPEADRSELTAFAVVESDLSWFEADEDFRFAAAVAAFGMLLRDSPHKGEATWSLVTELAAPALAADEHGYRAEFVGLIGKARQLAEARDSPDGEPRVAGMK